MHCREYYTRICINSLLLEICIEERSTKSVITFALALEGTNTLLRGTTFQLICSIMGCSASRFLTLLSPGGVTPIEGSIESRAEYLENARAVLSRVRIIPAVQRRRASSVGLPEEDGVYWVYWRPEQEENQVLEIRKDDCRARSERIHYRRIFRTGSLN